MGQKASDEMIQNIKDKLFIQQFDVNVPIEVIIIKSVHFHGLEVTRQVSKAFIDWFIDERLPKAKAED